MEGLSKKIIRHASSSLSTGAGTEIQSQGGINIEEIIENLEEELGITLIRTQREDVFDYDFCFENEVRICNGKIISLGICELAITALPKSLDQLIDLKYLTIDNCVNLIYFESLASLKYLDGLRLSDLSIVNLPKEISSLQNLKKLNLNSISFLENFNSLSYLSNLEELELKDLEIEKLPQEIRYNKNLKRITLHFRENLIDFKVLKFVKNSLEYIDIRSEEYSYVPMIIRSLKNLKEYHMKTYSGIRDISNLKNLKHLKEISLGCLEIDTLPKNLNTLTNLEKLFIYKSNSVNADKLKGLKKLKHLIGTTPPKYAYTFKNLETLEVTSYDFIDISMIKDLKKLLELNLRVYEVTDLPEELFTCSNLISLCVWANLEFLPESISKLEKLEELTLRNCMNLKDIKAINKLQNLRLLRIYELKDKNVKNQIIQRENLDLDIQYIN